MIRNALLPLGSFTLAIVLSGCVTPHQATPAVAETAPLANVVTQHDNAPQASSESTAPSPTPESQPQASDTQLTNTQASIDTTPSVSQALPAPAALPRIPADTLYALLAAEMAGSRSNYGVALTHYAEQARLQRDPQLAERATLIARYIDNKPLAYEMASLWNQLQPSHPPALTNAALAAIQQGKLLEAVGYSEQLLQRGEPTLFQMIAVSTEKTPNVDREALLDAFTTLLKTYPNDEQLLVGAALLHEQARDFTGALALSERALRAHPTSFAAAVLEANLLHQLSRTADAVRKMRPLIERAPQNIPLRQQYAFMLIKTDLALAKEQLEWLSDNGSQDGYVLLLLAQMALADDDHDKAITHYEQLVDTDQHRQTAHFELGKLYQARGNVSDAIMHFLQVTDNELYLSAANRLLALFLYEGDIQSADEHMARVYARFPEHKAALYGIYAQALADARQLSQAIRVFQQALDEFPTNLDLRYSRGLLFYQYNRLDDAESDFKVILAQDPDHVATLNSFGYMLAEKTNRLDEAEALLIRALQHAPDDAAIIDSMGWLLYRQGATDRALIHLQRAYQLAPLADIAAHLGEVLWVSGKTQEARDIWREGLHANPDAAIILNTIKRLDADS